MFEIYRERFLKAREREREREKCLRAKERCLRARERARDKDREMFESYSVKELGGKIESCLRARERDMLKSLREMFES